MWIEVLRREFWNIVFMYMGASIFRNSWMPPESPTAILVKTIVQKMYQCGSADWLFRKKDSSHHYCFAREAFVWFYDNMYFSTIGVTVSEPESTVFIWTLSRDTIIFWLRTQSLGQLTLTHDTRLHYILVISRVETDLIVTHLFTFWCFTPCLHNHTNFDINYSKWNFAIAE